MYDSSQVGVMYKRITDLIIKYNPDMSADVRFVEVSAVKMADGTIREFPGTNTQVSYHVDPSSYSDVRQLVNPTTGAAIPGATTTRQAIMLGILADCRDAQIKRDEAAAAALAALTTGTQSAG
jgi:hypothetical protein